MARKSENKNFYSREGLQEIGEIVKASLEKLNISLRQAEEKTGVSHSVIGKIARLSEDPDSFPQPTIETLRLLAKITPYTFEELIAIATGRYKPVVREVQVAEDLIPLAEQLSDSELARLAAKLVEIALARKHSNI